MTRDPAPASVSDMMANLTEESQQAPGTHKAKEAVHQAIRWVGYFSFDIANVKETDNVNHHQTPINIAGANY